MSGDNDRHGEADAEGREWVIDDTVTCVSCPDCAFTFDAFHEDASGGYSCPACAEARLTAEVARLAVAVRVQRGTDYARVGVLASQRAAVLALMSSGHASFRDARSGERYFAESDIRRALGADT